MKLTGFVRRVLAVALIAATVAVMPGTSVTRVSAACTWCGGGEYHAVAPTRIFDSRAIYPDPSSSSGVLIGINDVPPLGPKSLATTLPGFDVDLLGISNPDYVNKWLPADVVATDVLGVVASVTVVGPTQKGHMRAYATGSPSVTAISNFNAGQTIPNLAILRPNASGNLTIAMYANNPGNAHVVIDVFGWFSTSGYRSSTGDAELGARGARLFPIDPARILDTRNDAAADTPIGDNSQIDVAVRGAMKMGTGTVVVPNDPNVVGVVLNVTAVRPTATTFVSVLPDAPSGPPATANLNVAPSAVKANLVIVPVGADGKVHIYNRTGLTNVVVDVMGYLKNGEAESTRKGRVVPLTSPFRAFDTRQVAFGGVPLGPGQTEDWSFAAFAGSVNIGGVSVGNQMGLLGNLTNAGLSRQNVNVSVEPSYLTVYPTPSTPSAPPLIANLNSLENSTSPLAANPVPNLALVKFGAAQSVRVFNARGYAHYILDVSAVVLDD